MLTLSLHVDGDRVAVEADGAPSHSFPLADIRLTPEQARAFLDDPSVYGARLFAALFPEGSPARWKLDALPLAPDGVLLLGIPAPAPGAPDLHSVPWEYLCDGHNWLATRYGMARALTPSPQPPSPSPVERERGRGWPEGPGEGVRDSRKFLFVPSDPLLTPRGEPAPYALTVAEEWEEIRGILQETDPALELVRVVPPTADGLGEALAGVRGGVFHFTGHGDWDGRTASLLFEQPSGAADPVEAGRVADLLRGRVSLAVLSACLSATPGERPEANLAALLCAQGVPFVLGMQFTVPDVSARQFVARFYRYLFRGETVLEAVRQGRMAVLNDPALPMEARRLAFGIPVLYVQGPRLPEFSLPEGRGLRVVEPAPRVDLSGLPVPEGGFFGRHRELVQIGERLVARHGAQRSAAVVTLHGTGGIGKTALLRRAAERFAWAFDGVLAVPLDPLPTRASVLGRMEGFLGLPEDPRLDPEGRQERVADALARQRVLLALDNFETLARAGDAGDADARALYRFLSGLPARGVAFLVSSRERTGLPGEVRVEVPGLDERAGAQVFRQWVSARQGALTEEGMWALVRRVGGHPLALKLLARRFDEEACSLREFVEALEAVLPEAAERWDEGRRHDTLRACFGFSLGPLAEREPALAEALARLTVFSGPFTDFLAVPVLFGAERVSEASEGEQEALVRQAAGALHRLWDRGLLEREEVPLGPRVEEMLHLYSVHPALAPFAREHLGAAARAEAEEGYFRAMRRLGSLAYAEFEKAGVAAFLARRCVGDLVRAARMHADREGSILRFHTGWLLRVFGDLEGAMGLYRESLAIDESLGDRRGKSATLHEMAYIHRVRGDLEGAMGLYRESLAILESLGDRRGKSATLHEMAYIHRVRGDLEGAMGLYREALAIDESLGDLRGKSATLHAMAYIYQVRGDLEGAMGLYRESLAIDESLGDRRGKSATLHQMAGILAVRGDLEGAMGLYRESLAIKESLGDLRGKAATLHEMAGILAVRGDLEGAMGLYREALAIDESLGDLRGKSATLHAMAYIHRVRGDLEGAMGLYRESLAILESLGDLRGKSATLHEMAGILAVRGDLEGAMGLYRESLAIKESLGDLRGKAATLHEMAGILAVRGDLEGAMGLYRESLAILESLGDLQGKSATLHNLAYIYQVRGDLEGAMGLYRESLAIKESLGDLRGKSATLAMMGQVWLAQGQALEGLRALRQALEILAGMGARADAEQVAGILVQVRQRLGPEMFDALWAMAGGSAPPVRALPVEEWIRESVRAAREGGPGREELRALAEGVAGAGGAPEELRALARVLLQILDGNFQPDLSGLPEEWAGWVRAAVGAG